MSDKDEISELRKKIAQMKDEIDRLQHKIDDGDDDDLDQVEAQAEKLSLAIEGFFDVVKRPVGKITFDVPVTEETQRAIRAMWDATGGRL